MAATTSLITVEDYLKMSADPDCEYVGGVLEERAVGEYDHSTWQIAISAYFLARQNELRSCRAPNCACRLHPIHFGSRT